MANRAAYSSSAARENPELRRRNVPALDDGNGALTKTYDKPDTKKTNKVCKSLSEPELKKEHVKVPALSIAPSLDPENA